MSTGATTPAGRGDNVASGSAAPTDTEISAALMASAANFAASTAPKGELMASFGASGADPEDTDFNALIRDIKDNPEKVLSRADLTAEQVLEIQRRLNPYAFVPGPPRKDGNEPALVRSLATSYTNLREEYLRRFTMTSLVGFIFQILDEWAVPVEVRRWVPHPRKKKGAATADAADAASAPFDPEVLVGKLATTLQMAQEALNAKKEYEAAIIRTKEEMAVDDKSVVAEQAKLASDGHAARAAGLLYAATNTACRLGLDAERRLDATVEEAAKYPEVAAILDRSNVRPGAGAQVEMPAELAKGVIANFLKHWLKYDPNIHVKAARDGKAEASKAEVQTGLGKVLADADDPARLPLEVVLAKAPKPTEEDADFVDIIRASRENYNAACHALRDRELSAALIYALMTDENADRFRRYLYPIPAGRDPLHRGEARKAVDIIPPQDTYHRWAFYTEVNYEELRTAVECLYNEKPDLDWAIGLWSIFEGTKDEVQKQFDDYCERYQDEVPSSIKKLDMGAWSLLGDFKKGRENIKFYNKHTEVLKRIMDRHTEDKKLGADLMRKRVKDLKAKNIAAEGPDAPGLKQYQKTATTLPSLGAEKVLSAVEMRRLERARGDPKAAKELEVLEQSEAKIIEFGRIAANRPLTAEETHELHEAKLALDKAVEMINVPDDALRVDYFTHDAKTGDFKKDHFFTKAEKPEHMEQIQRELAQASGGGAISDHPIARRQAAANAAGRLPGILEEASRAEKAKADAAATAAKADAMIADLAPASIGLGDLAPFAIQYMKLQEERTLAMRTQEAERDATARAADTIDEKAAAAGPTTIDVQIPGTNTTVPIPAGSVAVVIESIPDAAPAP